MSRSFWSAPAPDVAVEVTGTAVFAVAVGARGRGLVVTAWAREDLPAGAVTPVLNGRNVHDGAVLTSALGQVFGRLGMRPSRIALLLPDPVAKVSFVRLQHVPPKPRDLDQLLRFHVRKTAPFRLDDAQIAYAPASTASDGGREFVVVLARQDVVREYEDACQRAGAHAGLVDLSSLNVINAMLASAAAPRGDWLLVHVRPTYGTVAILRGRDLVFFRNRSADGEDSLADVVHQTAMYYEDRLGGSGIERIVLSGAHLSLPEVPEPDDLGRQLGDRVGAPVELLDPTSVVPMAERIAPRAELLDLIAPAVGVMVRERAA